MNVQMRNFLTAVASSINDGSKAVLAAFLLRKNGHEVDHFTQERGIFGFCSCQRFNMRLGNNQKMDWSLGIDVAKRQYLVILVNFSAADFAAGNLAENTIVQLHSSNSF